MGSLLHLLRGRSLVKLITGRSSGLPDLNSCATPVVPELGGKGENPARKCRRRFRPDPRAPPSGMLLLLPSQLAS
jgi:hypothetical protein